MTTSSWQWILILGSSFLLLWVSPLAKSKASFFKAQQKGRAPGTWALMGSLVISWLFAKSITNAANLGYSYGIVGGVAYAAYYLSFAVAGLVIYQMRVKGGFKSLHHYLDTRFGRGAVMVFSILIALRLFQEVWSNTMVIGGYFGDRWSFDFYLAIGVFTVLTLAYSLKGGMSSSILTDLIQLAFFGVLMVVILSVILPNSSGGAQAYLTSGEWTMVGGGNLLFLALIQSISYPFHDPVLTDRAFLSDARSTRRAFLWATPIGGLAIVLFSFVGIYGQQQGLSGPSDAPVLVAQPLGIVMMLVMNFIMVTSAASTLDSNFSSFAKLAVLDLGWGKTTSVKAGRIAMIAIALIGSLPILLQPDIIMATTLSGSMVIGLAPVFLLWKLKAPPMSFYLSIGVGLLTGIFLLLNQYPSLFVFNSGKYAADLMMNLVGTGLCFVAFLVPWALARSSDASSAASSSDVSGEGSSSPPSFETSDELLTDGTFRQKMHRMSSLGKMGCL
ncbi:MAG: sodium:solute symporter [Bacteroidota bacterium]